MARGHELESEIPAALAPLADHELVSEIRAGSAPSPRSRSIPRCLADDPGLTDRVTLKARDHGILTRTLPAAGCRSRRRS